MAKPVVLVTGASRPAGLGAAIAASLAEVGWDVALTSWPPYDATQSYRESAGSDVAAVGDDVRGRGARVHQLEADLADVAAPAAVFDSVEATLGPVSGLVVNHCECEPSDLVGTSIESLDRHYAVNVRASWLLLREFSLRWLSDTGLGRAVLLTSDHIIGNLPYGATKAAANAVALQAAADLGPRGITVNVVNPGPNDTGWFDDKVAAAVKEKTLLPRYGQPNDTANLIRFLFSPEGEWITGQLLYSNGGFRPTAA